AAEVAVGGVDGKTLDVGGAAEMRIAGRRLRGLALGDFGGDRLPRGPRDDGVAAEMRRAPERIPAVKVVEARFQLPGHRLVFARFRTGLELLLRQMDGHGQGAAAA